MTSQRRIGPAIAMTAGIAGAVALAALFPANASGEWNRVEDPWESAKGGILDASFGNPVFEISDPNSITLLEELPDGTFFYAADAHAGGIVIGLADAAGEGLSCSGAEPAKPELAAQPEDDADTGPRGGVACGTSLVTDDGGEQFIAIRAERAPAAANGYRHELRTFTTETELESYLEF